MWEQKLKFSPVTRITELMTAGQNGEALAEMLKVEGSGAAGGRPKVEGGQGREYRALMRGLAGPEWVERWSTIIRGRGPTDNC